MICSKCGKEVEKGTKFCPGCGEKIEEKKVVEATKVETKKEEQPRSKALGVVALVLGIVSLVVASLALVFALVNSIVNKKGFAAAGLGAAMLLAIGIFFIVRETTASNLIALVLDLYSFESFLFS